MSGNFKNNNYAVLDDSLYYDKEIGLYVYSHALVNFDETPNCIAFIGLNGNNRAIYSRETELFNFISENLFQDYELYACNHYKRYFRVWSELVKCEESEIPTREARAYFLKAHDAAKSYAKNVFDNYKKSNIDVVLENYFI